MELNKQQDIIKTLYAFFIFSTFLSFVPIGFAQVMSLALIVTTLIVAYFYKYIGKKDDILSNHMTYMIGTIWVSSSFLVMGMLCAAAIVYLKGDHTIVHNAVDQITSGTLMEEEEIKSLMMDYMNTNITILILASIPTIVPAILYFVYRIANGYSRAIKGYRIANPKGWL